MRRPSDPLSPLEPLLGADEPPLPKLASPHNRSTEEKQNPEEETAPPLESEPEDRDIRPDHIEALDDGMEEAPTPPGRRRRTPTA